MEPYLLIPIFGGLLIALVAWIWLVACVFQQSIGWGLVSLILPPAALWFAVCHAQVAVKPLVLLVAGGLMWAVPAWYLLVVPVGLVSPEKPGEESRLGSLMSTALRSDTVHGWVESRANYLQIGGVIVAGLAWIWLIARAFGQRQAWGWISLILPPVGLVFAVRHRRRGAAPLLLFSLAILVAAVPAIYILCVRLDLGPREKIVDGERHVTLTGWDRKDYLLLSLIKDATVLQMANPDVTDEVVDKLKDMKQLRELDLNHTQVTDAGLKSLQNLPVLARLRLAWTKITDKGFHEVLSIKDSLKELDLQHTQVSPETIKAWRDAVPGRRALR
jgi:Leucine Rich repeat